MPDAGRVITGRAGGLRLEAPGPGTRPLSDKVKQALFSLIEAERHDVWEHPMLDLFAGSGAAGIEALSRGAPRVVLVERDGRAVAIIHRNLARVGLAADAHVVRRDVGSFLAGPCGDVAATLFGCVFVDPPYEHVADLAASLERLGESGAGWLDDAAVVVAKHFWKTTPTERCGDLTRTRTRRFGETALSVYRRRSDTAVGGS